MTRFLSRFSSAYIRSLVYMMQASEYSVPDFLEWYWRVEDFTRVEKRKSLVWSLKARALFVLLWAATALLALFAVDLFFIFPLPYNIIAALLVAFVASFAPPYVLIFGTLLGGLIQIPVEARLIRQAKNKLATNKAVKIAIAGSYGKTSMREILKTVLSEGKKVAVPPGSYNTPLGIAQFISTLSGKEEVVIFELGEYYPGDVKKLCEFIRPDIGIITGVNEAHLEKFGTLDAAADTVFELAAFVAPDFLYVNAENTIAAARTVEENILYSRSGAGQFSIAHQRTGLEGTSFVILADDDSRIDAHSQLLGEHQVGALAAAADIAARLGLSLEHIRTGIAKTKPFEHRLEPRIDASGIVTLDDSYNGNPDGVAAVIGFLASLKENRRWYVTPGLVEMGKRKEAVHKNIGELLAKAGIEKVLLIRNSATPFIEQGLKENGYKGELQWYADMPKALEALQHGTVSGDVVLIQNDWPDQYA